MQDLLQQIIDNPLPSLLVVANLVLIESLLSVDNAAVLATMVKDLPSAQKNKALKYGIWGAYIFRGLAMLFVSFLIKIWWLKPLGGLYLIYLVYDWYQGKKTASNEDDIIDKNSNWFYKNTVGLMGPFWSTVVLVEMMDMAFSIDNVFAAVAYSPNIILICIGVFIGILAMRFIAQWFVELMEKFPNLETSAFLVILILGVKLVLSVVEHLYPSSSLTLFLQNHYTEVGLSLITVIIFFTPIIFSKMNRLTDESKN